MKKQSIPQTLKYAAKAAYKALVNPKMHQKVSRGVVKTSRALKGIRHEMDEVLGVY